MSHCSTPSWHLPCKEQAPEVKVMDKGEPTIKPLGKQMGVLRDLRARMFAVPFMYVNETTSWEFTGQDRLLACIEEHQRTGRGLITVSNHVSLFDDPLVLLAMLGIRAPSEDTKCWYSTACADNFNPRGNSMGARITRYFSEVSNIVFLSRAHKRGDRDVMEHDPVQETMECFDQRLSGMVERRASSLGMDQQAYVQSFLTPWGRGVSPSRIQTFNQPGLLQACIRVDSGDWVHFFPEGGRSRDMHLRPARPGVGKALFHAGEARVVPFCFYGTQDIMPVGSRFPLPGKTVHVKVGDPIDEADLASLRRRPESIDTYQAMSDLAMDHVAQLRPDVLASYLGQEQATRLLLEEAQMRRALVGSNVEQEASRSTDVLAHQSPVELPRMASGHRPG